MFAIHELKRDGDVYRCDSCGRAIPYTGKLDLFGQPMQLCREPAILGYDCDALEMPLAPDAKAADYARNLGYADWDTYVRTIHEVARAERRELAAMPSA